MSTAESFSEGIRSLEDQSEGRPSIVLSNLDARDRFVAARVAMVGLATKCAIFRDSQGIVAIDHLDDGTTRVPLDADLLRAVLDRGVGWFVMDRGGELKPSQAPVPVCRDILAVPPDGLRYLRGITAVPLVARDGRILDVPGHDLDTGWFYAPATEFKIPTVQRNPSPADIEAARLLLIDDLLGDFEFESQADLANTIALILTGLLREFFGGPSPLFVIEADRAGTGKTLLARVIAILLTGSELDVMSMPPDEDQIGKKVTAALTKGRRFLVFDNISRPVDSGNLAALATTEIWSDRRLQTSDMLELPNRGIWVLTGNQIQLSREIERRSVRILLEPTVLGEDRTYKYPELEQWVSQNRGLLVWAALTLVSRWVSQGQPAGTVILKSYVSWARVLGGVLDLLGIEGFLQNRDRHQEEFDEEAAAEREFFEHWHQSNGPRSVHAKDLLDIAIEVELRCLVGKVTPRQRLTALGMYLGRVWEKPKLAPLGYRVVRSVDRAAKIKLYSVQRVPERDRAQGLSTFGSVVPLARGPAEVPARSRPVSSDSTTADGTSGTSVTSSDPRENQVLS